jgi:prepilin-type N-terminal cleavage/methylation domain-containing protein
MGRSWKRGRLESDRRRGFSSLEVVVALAVFGVMMSGLAATTISQLRMIHAIERRVYVLAPQGSTIEVLGYDVGAQSYTYSPTLSTEQVDILGPTNTWAMQLGATVLAARDCRKPNLPTTISAPFTLSLNTPLDSYAKANNVTLRSDLQDLDGTTTATVNVEAVP